MSFPASATDLALESRIHDLVAAGSMEISPRELHRLKEVAHLPALLIEDLQSRLAPTAGQRLVDAPRDLAQMDIEVDQRLTISVQDCRNLLTCRRRCWGSVEGGPSPRPPQRCTEEHERDGNDREAPHPVRTAELIGDQLHVGLLAFARFTR